jgi:hypothetical protein
MIRKLFCYLRNLWVLLLNKTIFKYWTDRYLKKYQYTMPRDLKDKIEEVFSREVFKFLPSYTGNKIALVGLPIVGAYIEIQLGEKEYADIKIVLIKGGIEFIFTKWSIDDRKIIDVLNKSLDNTKKDLRAYIVSAYSSTGGDVESLDDTLPEKIK